MDVDSLGGWVIHHAQKMKKVTGVNRFQNIQHAGTCGILLAALAGTRESTVSKEKASIIASNAGLSGIDLNYAVNALKENNLLDTSKSGSELHLLGLTQQTVLTHVSTLYNSLGESSEDDVVLLVAEEASKRPLQATKIKEVLQDTKKLQSSKVDSILASAEQIGFFDKEQISTDILYFNGNLFRRDFVGKSQKILDSLSNDDARRMQELLDILKTTPCILLAQAYTIVGEPLFNQLKQIGLLDVSEISNPRGKTQYVSKPAAYCKYGTANDDPLDDAKALVT